MITIRITENNRGSFTVNVVGVGEFTRYNQSAEAVHEIVNEIFFGEKRMEEK